jgi:thiol-disulfide isomerase/thioredoxin
MMNFDAQFEKGLAYEPFLAKYATDEQRRRWGAVHAQVRLTEAQRSLLASFVREMKVLVVAGTWCGDCVNQCPIFAHVAGANARIRIRFFDRDDQPELAAELSICGAPRVPSVLFLSEDGFSCSRAGDRTLAAYRDIASRQLGPSCPTGLVPHEKSLLEDVVEEWLDEFERVQLMLRTSARLRQRHGD